MLEIHLVRKRFAYFLDTIRNDLLQLGHLVKQMFSRTVYSMRVRSLATGRWVLEQQQTAHVNSRRIEHEVFQLLATQQPIVAFDLRMLLAIMQIASELERIAEAIACIAREALCLMSHSPAVQLPVGSSDLFVLTQQMLATGVHAFECQNLEEARSLAPVVQQVHLLEKQLHAELIACATSTPQWANLHLSIDSMLLAVQTISHHTAIIGERVIYMLTCTQEDLIAPVLP